MRPRVYIPSRGRWGNVPKLVKAWDEQDFDMVFMVEPTEIEQYTEGVEMAGLHENTVNVKALPGKNLGVGFSRARCVEHARDVGLQAIIMSDDDIKPKSGMDALIWDVQDPFAVVMVAYHDYMDLALGVKGKERNDIAIVAPSFTRMWAINIEQLEEIGGFDEELKCIDDEDLRLRSARMGMPWMIHFGAKASSFGPRFGKGGVTDLEEQETDGELVNNQGDVHVNACNRIMAKNHDLVDRGWMKMKTPTRISYRWTSIYDHFMPEWREWSFKYGGDIKNYFGMGWMPYGDQ